MTGKLAAVAFFWEPEIASWAPSTDLTKSVLSPRGGKGSWQGRPEQPMGVLSLSSGWPQCDRVTHGPRLASEGSHSSGLMLQGEVCPKPPLC